MWRFISELFGGGGPRPEAVAARRVVEAGGLLLDVRTVEEFAQGHLPGALNVPVAEIETRVGELDPARPVVVYCRSGMRSARAARVLETAGFSTVLDLGAMSSWPRTMPEPAEPPPREPAAPVGVQAPLVQGFFDPATSSLTYVVYDRDTKDAIVIDPVLDFDPRWVRVEETSIQKVVDFVSEHNLHVHVVLDTHVHADHLSGLRRLAEILGAKCGIGRHIGTVQATFRDVFHWGTDFPVDGSQFDLLLDDGVPLRAGSLEVLPIHTPGHTPACLTYRVGDALFTGDTMFMPDYGTGRCDFPGGSAEQLYDSVQKLYALPPSLRVFVGHDYQPQGRPLRYETTLGECREHNVQLSARTDKAAFVAFRTARDATLTPPKLIFQSLQVNANGGRLPEPASNGWRYLRMPMNVFDES